MLARSQVGPYQLLESLGTGGMGEVFRARDTRLGRLVAIKRIRIDRQVLEEYRARFRREARVLARLNHPSVVQLYDVLSQDDTDWIVTEYVDGPPLRQVLESGPMPADRAISLAGGIASGLAAVHSAGLIHRDLKTENVLISSEGLPKIVDFGVAKPLLPKGNLRTLTAAGGLVGTVRAMAPEQIRGEPTGPHSDLFSFGVLLYEMVCGVSPFAAESKMATLVQVLEHRQRPADEVLPGVPVPLSQLIDHLLEKDPRLRPRGAGEVSRALARMAPSVAGETTRAPSGEAVADPETAVDAAPRGPSAKAVTVKWSLRALAVLGVVVVLIALSWPRPLGVVLSMAGLLDPESPPDLPELPSIAVLPFANLSHDSAQETFCDGLTEELTIDLSRQPELFVISSGSAFTYKGQPVTLEQVGRELGVRYIVEGTVRQSQDMVRVSARLSEAGTGFQVASLRYDRPADEVLALQSQLSREILLALRGEIDEAELARVRQRPMRDLTAYHAFLRGRILLHRNTRDGVAEARRMFERALELDPHFAPAQALLGATYGSEFTLFWRLDPALLERQAEHAYQALELDPSITEAYLSLANVAIQQKRYEVALAQAERALAIDPNHSVAHAFRGAALAALGRRLEGLQALHQAVRLDPRTPSVAWSVLGALNQWVGRERQAVALWERLRAANPDLIHPRIFLMMTYEAKGRSAEAQALAREVLAINPELTAALAAEHFGSVSSSGPAAIARRRESLRRAGLR